MYNHVKIVPNQLIIIQANFLYKNINFEQFFQIIKVLFIYLMRLYKIISYCVRS